MAKVQGTFYTGEKLRRGTSPVSPPYLGEDGQPYPVNPPGSPAISYLSLVDTKDATYIGKNGFVPVVTGEDGLLLQPIPQLQENGLISGGVVQWTGTGYVFNVSEALARFQAVSLMSSAAQVTLDAADPTDDRKDAFVLDVTFSGGVPVSMAPNKITGTPSATPILPQIDPSYQIFLTSVDVPAASTAPTLTEEVIYDENIEWTGTSGGTGTANFASAVDPYQGSVSVEVTNIQNGFYIDFDYGSTIDISTFQTLGFQIKLKAAMPANQNLIAVFGDNSGNPASSSFVLNFDKSSTSYQFVGIVLSGLSIVEPNIRYLRIVFTRSGGSPTYSGYFLDILKLEGGINPPVTSNSFLNLTDVDAPTGYVGQASKVVSVKADESGLEFITGGGGGITGSGTVNEIAYFTGTTAIGSLSVMTYPSLAELAHVKGLTSPAQTQLNGKQATIAGTLTNGHVATVVAGVPTWSAPSGGGGADTNAVHYNAADGKNGTEKIQALTNLGLRGSQVQTVATTGTINDFAKTSNNLLFTGAGAVTITGIIPVHDGEEIIITNATGFVLTIADSDALSSAANRFLGGIIMPDNSSVSLRYNSVYPRWVISSSPFVPSDAGTGLIAFRSYTPLSINRTPFVNVGLAIQSIAGTSYSILCYNNSSQISFEVQNSTAAFPNSILGVRRAAVSNVTLVSQCISGGFAFGLYTTAGANGAFVNNTMDWTSIGGAAFGVTAGGTPTARVDVRGRGTTTGIGLLIEDSAGTDNARFLDNGQIQFLRLPTSSAGLAAGSLWNNLGILSIV